MSYVAQRKIFNLRFETYPELEVRVSSITLGQMFEVADQADRARAGAGLAEIRGLTEVFAAHLASWNVVNELGEAVPLTMDGFSTLDMDLALAMMVAWFEAMTGVDRDLGKGSTSGDTSLVAEIPMTAA